MPSYRTLKTFRHWLRANRGRFLFPPKVIRRTRHSYVLRFAGITPHFLWLVDNEGWNELWVSYRGQQFDRLMDFSVRAKRAGHRGSGWYQDWFLPAGTLPDRYYRSKRELLIECSWEPLLAWVNTRLGGNSWLYFYADKDSGFAMTLFKQQSPGECPRPWEQEVNGLERYFLEAVPVRVSDKK